MTDRRDLQPHCQLFGLPVFVSTACPPDLIIVTNPRRDPTDDRSDAERSIALRVKPPQ